MKQGSIGIHEHVIKEAVAKWPTTIVARKAISSFTGGAITGRTMANLDSQGQGPEGSFKIGQQVVYPVDALGDWLIGRVKSVEED